jgi:predicted homoserine dehydrogenase-like protein
MFTTQVRRVAGLELAWVADLDLDRARAAAGGARVSTDASALIAELEADVVVEATGSPAAAAGHAIAAIEHGRHVVMVTVEADALVGPALAQRARAAGVVYSLAYGDQPALICELVEWARVCGFEVVCAGKGTLYRPGFHQTTPDTVWEHYGSRPEGADAHMFTTFVDGTKSAIEMAAVCNATGLAPQAEGLRFPPCSRDELAELPTRVSRSGTVEVIASDDLRWGVFVVFAAADETTRRALVEYGVQTDRQGRWAALYRPNHLVGLELAVSVLRAGLRAEATGTPSSVCADVVAVAKRDLQPGEVLDGEGGYTVYGALAPLDRSLGEGLLPIGLSGAAALRRPVAAGEPIALAHVELHADELLLRLRREALASASSPASHGRGALRADDQFGSVLDSAGSSTERSA